MPLPEHLTNCIQALNTTYSAIHAGGGSHARADVTPDLNSLVKVCFDKYDTWKSSVKKLFTQKESKTLQNYIDHLNDKKDDHHHARMLFQILFTVAELEKSQGEKIIPGFSDIRLSGFVDNVRENFSRLHSNPTIPAEAKESYQKFQAALSEFQQSNKQAVVDKTVQILNDPDAKLDANQAKEFFHATVGTGVSPGKKVAEKFMAESAPNLPIEKLIELTRGVMQAQRGANAIGANEPFLRQTGVITDKLYQYCAMNLNYDPVAKETPTEMVKLNREILLGKGYINGVDSKDSESAKNAAVEIIFKLQGIGKHPDIEKIAVKLHDEVKRILPPPVPQQMLDDIAKRKAATAPLTDSPPPIPPRPNRPRSSTG